MNACNQIIMCPLRRSHLRQELCAFTTIIANTTLPRNRGHITLRNGDTQLIRSIADLAGATMSEKVNIPGDIVSDIMWIEGNQTIGSHQSQIHI